MLQTFPIAPTSKQVVLCYIETENPNYKMDLYTRLNKNITKIKIVKFLISR